MVECDYCGEEVAGEEAYREHLGAEHEGGLSPVDQRRVEAGTDADDEGLSRRTLLGGGAVVVGLAGITYVAATRNSGGGGGGIAAQPLPEQGDDELLQGLETHPADDRTHVDSGTDIDYDESPPAAGRHYNGTVRAGFYAEPVTIGELVHSLEHGAVVDYYDPSALTDPAEESLRSWASNYTDPWMSFIAVPTPVDDPDHPHVLAAWERLLRLDEYDDQVVQAFCAEFIGRGPENPVR